MKTYNVSIGIKYKIDGKLRIVTCLNRNGKTIGTREFLDGVCDKETLIDGLSTELKVYFAEESRDVLKINSETGGEVWASKPVYPQWEQKIVEYPDKGNVLEIYPLPMA